MPKADDVLQRSNACVKPNRARHTFETVLKGPETPRWGSGGSLEGVHRPKKPPV